MTTTTDDTTVETTQRGRIADSAIVFDESTDGEELLRRMNKENEDEVTRVAATSEFFRRATQFDISRVGQDLITTAPFYGYITMQLNKIKTVSIPTAAVSIVNDMFVMWWNPMFFTRISPDWEQQLTKHRYKSIGVLMHECLHLVLEHTTARRGGIEHPIMWNWATDLAINSMIRRDMLPDGLLMPGEPFSIPEGAENVYEPQHLKQYEQLSNFIASLPKYLAAEDYYDRLLQFVSNNMPDAMTDPQWGMPKQGQAGSGESNQQGAEGGQGDGEGAEGGQGDGEGAEGGQGPKDGSGRGQSHTSGWGRLGQFDDHNKWDDISETDKEQIKQRVKDMLRGAIREADNQANGWGSMPQEVQAQLRKIASDTIDWRLLLRQFVGYINRMNMGSTLKKLNRRFPYVHPGRRRSRGASIRIYIDQSGSMDDESIGLLFGELNGLSKRCDFEVYFFDTSVDTKNVIKWRRGSKHPAARVRSGGTDFDAVTRHCDENPDVDGIIILTDGECSKPQPCRVKRAWVVIPGHKLLFETDELVVQMDRDKRGSEPA